MTKFAALATPVRAALVAVSFFLFFVGFCVSVAAMERLRANGATVILELAPVDPRALLLGDYMDLEYDVDRRIANALYTLYRDGSSAGRNSYPRAGTAVMALDDRRRADFVRLDDGAPLQSGEVRLRFHVGAGGPHAGATAFYFEEGFADQFASARFGEFRVAPDGGSLLVYLLDRDMRRIIPVRTTDR
jgi:uncharacterized membrane-anchored protein